MYSLSVKKKFLTALYCFLLFAAAQRIALASPTITTVQIHNIGYTSVTIKWLTDVPSNSQISYGEKDVNAVTSDPNRTFNTEHSVTLQNLRPATRYMFKVTSTTEEGLSVSSDIQSFSTLSFTFTDDDTGTFGNINATPTPTPYTNPYAQYLPQTTTPNYANQQQPLYIVPPIVYQQPQTNTGQTLGETNTQQTLPAAQASDSLVISLIQSSIWGVIIIFGILIVILVLLFNQLMKNKKELHELQQQLLQAGTTQNPSFKNDEPERKVYRFDVRS